MPKAVMINETYFRGPMRLLTICAGLTEAQSVSPVLWFSENIARWPTFRARRKWWRRRSRPYCVDREWCSNLSLVQRVSHYQLQSAHNESAEATPQSALCRFATYCLNGRHSRWDRWTKLMGVGGWHSHQQCWKSLIYLKSTHNERQNDPNVDFAQQFLFCLTNVDFVFKS